MTWTTEDLRSLHPMGALLQEQSRWLSFKKNCKSGSGASVSAVSREIAMDETEVYRFKPVQVQSKVEVRNKEVHLIRFRRNQGPLRGKEDPREEIRRTPPGRMVK